MKLQIAKDSEKQISGIALCTTKGSRDMAQLIKSSAEITRANRVSIVISRLGNQEQVDFAASIIRCDDSTATHYTWKRNGVSRDTVATSDTEMGNQSIEELSKNLLGGNLNQKKLSTTSIAIKQIIDWITSTLLTEQTTHISIELLPILSDKGMTFQICSLTEKHIERISDSSRYKMCGNAVTTNVVQAVFERIFSNG